MCDIIETLNKNKGVIATQIADDVIGESLNFVGNAYSYEGDVYYRQGRHEYDEIICKSCDYEFAAMVCFDAENDGNDNIYAKPYIESVAVIINGKECYLNVTNEINFEVNKRLKHESVLIEKFRIEESENDSFLN